MLETLKYIRPIIENDARQIDITLIRNRTAAVAKNFTQLTDVNRSQKFMERKGGLDERRSAHQDAVLWFAATAIEDPDRASMVEALWSPLFSYARTNRLFIPVGFWDLEETAMGLHSQLRSAFLSGNRIEARFLLIKLRENSMSMLQAVDQELLTLR
jgi:hypothetical protein